MATGTPLSNSVTELHAMMRFLEYDFLKEHGLSNFDNWVTVITLFAPKNFLFAAEDCAVAAENMMLVANSLGVGSCYIGQGWTAFADPYGQEVLRHWNIRTDYYAVMQLLLGYPREGDEHPTPKVRKEGRILRV